MILLNISFEIIFLINLVAYWGIFIKIKNPDSKIRRCYKRIFPVIWTICLILPIFLSSSFFQFIFKENISYFQQFWGWFLVLGIIFLTIGIAIVLMVNKQYKVKVVDPKELKLIISGVYSVVRHPIYLSWILISMGFSFIFDSFITILFIPILTLLLEIHSILEEKYVLLPNFGDEYLKYKKKIPFRLFARPYNYLLVIVALLVIYIGFLNFILNS